MERTIVRQGVCTAILTPAAAAAGLTVVAARLVGLVEPGSPWDLLGVSLLLCSVGGGLLLHRLYRQGCDRLARSADGAVIDGAIRQLNWPDDQLSPLVAALNRCLRSADSTVEDAIAEMKRLAVELRIVSAQRTHAEAVIGSIEDAVLVTNPFDEVILMNDAARALFGAERTGEDQPIQAVVSDAAVVEIVHSMRESRSNGRRVCEIDLQRNGTSRRYRATLSCLHDGLTEGAENEPRGVMLVMRDSTRDIEMQEAKNQFVSAVTHELRTPLASIRAYVEMLVDGEADDERTRKEFYGIIESEAQRLTNLIDSILNISRIESGLVRIDRRPQSPTLIGEKALEVIESQAKMKNIAIRRELLPATFQVVADHDLLHQVILNLLSNAVKYTPEGGCVTLRTTVDADRGVCRTEVQDDGAGVPEADLPHVFEKFYRVEKNNGLASGTGLGLPLVKRVIEQDFGGVVYARSREGLGSTFGFELPLYGGAKAAA